MQKATHHYYYFAMYLLFLLTTTNSVANEQVLGKKDEKPAWVERMLERPDLLQGIGIAEERESPEQDQARADNAAITQIIHEISTTVTSKMVDFYQETSEGRSISTLEVFSSVSTHYAKETIKGIKIADRYYDRREKIYYSYAYISQADLDAQFREKAKNVVQLSSDYHRYALAAIREKNVYSALTNYGKALAELFIAQAFLKRKLEGDLENDGQKEMLQARLESEISSIISKLYFEPVSGNGQKAERNRGLRDPLVGKAIFMSSKETYPVHNLPVSLKFINATGELTRKVLTNADGTFSGYVNLIETADAENGIIRATLDFAELEPFRSQIPEMFERMQQVGVNFNFLIDVTASVRIFVKIYEEMDGVAVRNTYTTGSVIEALIRNKFSVIEIAHLTSGHSVNDIELAIEYRDDKTIVSAAKNDADYAVIGSVFSQTGDTMLGGGLVFSRASADVRVIDLLSGRVVASSVQSGVKAAGNNSSKANKSAIKKCSELVVRDIVEGLKEALK